MNTEIKVPLELVELEADNYHVLVRGELDNEEELWWILDTGASKTVFDENCEEHYTLIEQEEDTKIQSAGINQSIMDTKLGQLRSFCIGGVQLEHTSLALLNLDHINKIYKQVGRGKIIGLLGSDVLKKYAAVISYAKQEMILHIEH